jgi:hypothetical protein
MVLSIALRMYPFLNLGVGRRDVNEQAFGVAVAKVRFAVR